jgi:heme exporter protein C
MSNPLINWFRYASPQTFYPLAGKMIPWFWALAALFGVAGLTIGFLIAPTDAQQGEGYRIIFLHVPASWMSMFIYLVMAFWAGHRAGLQFRLSGMMASALAPTGALFAFLSLWTGALWGKPMWGTWWVWDARLTSELILLFLYIGFIALQAAIDDPRRADKAGAILALVGVVNIPIIYFSVKWWNTLHQGASVSLTKRRAWPPMMLWGMLLCALACWMYSIAVALMRVRTIMLERERHTDWVRALLSRQGVRTCTGTAWPSFWPWAATASTSGARWRDGAADAGGTDAAAAWSEELIARLKRQYRAEISEAGAAKRDSDFHGHPGRSRN